MKELKELGFEYLPTLSEYAKACLCDDGYCYFSSRSNNIANKINESIIDYINLIDQQPKLVDFIPCIDGVPVDEPELRTDVRCNADIEARRYSYRKALEKVKFEGHDDIEDWFGEDFEGTEVLCIWDGYTDKIYYTYEQAINDGVKFKIK